MPEINVLLMFAGTKTTEASAISVPICIRANVSKLLFIKRH